MHWKVKLTGNGPAGCGIAGEAFVYGPHVELVAEEQGAPVPPKPNEGAARPDAGGSPSNSGSGTATCKVRSGGARAFASASFSSQVIQTLAAGITVKKVGTSNAFVRINLGGQIAFVSENSLDCGT